MRSHTNIKRFLVNQITVPALLVCFVTFTVYKGNSLILISNMVDILRATAINTVFDITATITMAPDGFDMSAGTLASCSVYVFVFAYLWLRWSLGMLVLTCVLATLVMYRLAMFLIPVCKIPDMPATCALTSVHQGIGQQYIGGGTVSTGMKASWEVAPARTVFSEPFLVIGCAPWIIIIVLGRVLVAYLFFNFTKHGRYLYAMGSNKEAAELSGINVERYRYLAGMTTAVFIAIGGILMTSRGSSTRVMCCDNCLMPSLAAVFVGRIASGTEKPNAPGTMIGAMLVSTLENGPTIYAVPFYVLPAAKGFVLTLALIAVYASKKED